MKHGSLFSGIGGFDLAAEWMGWENVFHCEIAEFPRKILKYHFPNSICYEDIKKTDFTKHRGKIDIISGGFPCQPFSHAGRRKGTDDDRYLWPAMFESIKLIRPDWTIVENVAGLVTWNEGMVLEQVCTDLESEGYEVQPFIIPACAVNAPHRRDRIWIVANRESGRQRCSEPERNPRGESEKEVGNRDRNGWNQNWFEVATQFCRVDDGISYWLDGRGRKRNSRSQRLKALWNSIVPQVAEVIIKQIKF